MSSSVKAIVLCAFSIMSVIALSGSESFPARLASPEARDTTARLSKLTFKFELPFDSYSAVMPA